LLGPLKRKYGAGLSWGDLIALAGTHAMWHQGAPLTEFCFGRLDEPDGNRSLPLGPGPLQEEVAPCAGPEQGACQDRPNETALASVQVGLIYVNPEGPMGVPDPAGSARDIKTVFEKMGADARSTVALIGGGHAFGKVHGACSDKEYEHPAGLPPSEAREANVYPYVGKCPPVGDGTTGTGLATWTSGFEGPWTSTPTQWSNEFFVYLVDKEWELWTGPGGHYQWRLKDQPDDPRMRLTSDMALLADPEFRHWVEVFARNATALDEAFDAAWHNLVNAGGGWSSSKRCVQLGSPPENPAAPSRMLDTDTDPFVASGSQSIGVAGLAALASLVAQVPSFAS
jgi:catalase (peroxidase I)